MLDSGVTTCRNVGDQALLNYTLKIYPSATWIRADKLLVFKEILNCDLYIFVAGGLLKNLEKQFMIRKLYAVALARLFRKKVYVDTQTVFLKGFWRALFKLVFICLTVKCRDPFSLRDVETLGLKAEFKRDPLICSKKKWRKKEYIALDTRYRNFNQDLCLFIDKFLQRLEKKTALKIVEVPTMYTDLAPSVIEKLFAEAKISVCASYHAVVFSKNGGHSYIFVTDNIWREYNLRKLSGLKWNTGLCYLEH